jgi:hypothetical protein
MPDSSTSRVQDCTSRHMSTDSAAPDLRPASGLNITYLMQTYTPLPWYDFSLFIGHTHQNSPCNPHKFAHLDYTALENILVTGPRKSKKARVSLHNPTADRWHLVPDSWLFDSQCHCPSRPFPLFPFPKHFALLIWQPRPLLEVLEWQVRHPRRFRSGHTLWVESRPVHSLSWLRLFMILLSPSKQILG